MIELNFNMKHSSQKKNTRSSATHADHSAAIQEVKAIYQEWAGRELERSCIGRSTCCQFTLTGKTPYITRGEAILAAKGWRAAGRKTIPVESLACPFLHQGKCQIYESRPFACRTHFCDAAGGPAPRTLVRDLIQRLEEIDQRLGGQGGVNLPTAVRDFLA
jgi:uncharacterized protein